MNIARFSPDRLAEIVDLVNQGIAGRRAAASIRPADFQERVLDNPALDATGLFIALNEAGQAVGLVHAVAPALQFAEYARLAGTGFVMGPYVSGGWRGRGIGHSLLREAEGYLRDRCDHIQIHGLRTPFYGTLEGPRQPFCGSTEIMGLCADDIHFLEWLASAGYRKVEEGEVSMVGGLASCAAADGVPAGLEVVRITERERWSGTVAWRPWSDSGYGYDKYGPCRYDTVALARGQTILGHCQWYPMRKPGRAALFDLRLDPALRGQGLGSFLFLAGLRAMEEQGYAEVELHTSPQRNAVAYAMYRASGLVVVENWIIMEKRWS